MKNILPAAVLMPLAVFSFHVQVGVTAYNKQTAQWQSNTVEIGGGGRVNYANFDNGPYSKVEIDTGAFYVVASIDQPGKFGIDAHGEGIGSWPQYFLPEECVPFPGGIGYLPGGSGTPQRSHANAVVTMRGDPYSTVINETGRDRTINGVTIPNGGSARLPFPVYLKMDKVEGMKFIDVDTGNEITPLSFYAGSATYFQQSYCLCWSGNILLSVDTTDDAQTLGVMLHSDADTNKLLYARNNMPIHSGKVSLSTNVMLQTEWVFVQEEWGNPQARINDEVVCDGHSTSHIIPHTVTGEVMYDVTTGGGSWTFTMSQTPESGKSGGACTFRCWDKEIGTYDAAPSEHRASISGGVSTVATFRVTMNVLTGEWKVEPVN